RFRKGLAKLGMIARAVVALAVVFPDELPVALLDDRGFVGDLRVAQAMGQEERLHHRAERREIHRAVGETYEDVSTRGLAGDRLQAEAGRVETLAHLAREEKRTFEVIGPLMVGTDQLGGTAAMLQA